MSRSINNADTNWKRDWDEEQTLTPEEQKEADRLKALEEKQTAQILEDLHMIRWEEEQVEEAYERKVRNARSYLKVRGWRDGAIWALSDEEVLQTADVEEREYSAYLINCYNEGDSQ